MFAINAPQNSPVIAVIHETTAALAPVVTVRTAAAQGQLATTVVTGATVAAVAVPGHEAITAIVVP